MIVTFPNQEKPEEKLKQGFFGIPELAAGGSENE